MSLRGSWACGWDTLYILSTNIMLIKFNEFNKIIVIPHQLLLHKCFNLNKYVYSETELYATAKPLRLNINTTL